MSKMWLIALILLIAKTLYDMNKYQALLDEITKVKATIETLKAAVAASPLTSEQADALLAELKQLNAPDEAEF